MRECLAEEAKQYKYHGLRRTTATLQMEYGDNLPESEVMKATRHSSERSFRLYNQESAQKLARHANRQTDIAFLAGVISDWRQFKGRPRGKFSREVFPQEGV